MGTVGVVGHTGVVGGAVFSWFKDRGPTVGWSPDRPEWDWSPVDLVFVCVPTPYRSNPDEIVDEVVAKVPGGAVVVVKSTTLPGTTQRLQVARPDLALIAMPEFLSTRSAEKDWARPRVQLIGYTETSQRVVRDVVKLLPRCKNRHFAEATVVELAKLVHNAMGALQVIAANLWYDAAGAAGTDYTALYGLLEASNLLGNPLRYWDVWQDGYRGYRGKCFPKDVGNLIGWLNRCGVGAELLETVRLVNHQLLCEQFDDADAEQGE